MTTSPKEYYSTVSTHALAGFQLIEGSIKDYMDSYFEFIRNMIHKDMFFNFKSDDYKGHSLGRLVEVFSKITSNKKLIKDINKLVNIRNELAHRALTVLYGKEKSDEFYLKQSKQYEDILLDLSNIMESITKEHVKLYGLSKKTNIKN